ncbi:hypothetical protein L1887_54125 [Cichorium endivia]|nr:hypothetical protein L1887_54125 [Cichorium endivia]
MRVSTAVFLPAEPCGRQKGRQTNTRDSCYPLSPLHHHQSRCFISTPRPSSTTMPGASETTPLRSSPPRNGTDPAKNGQYGAVPDQAGARADAGAGAADAPEPEHPQGFKFAVIIASLWVVLFMAALDGTIVVTLISSISSSFKASEKSGWSARPICCRCAPSRRSTAACRISSVAKVLCSWRLRFFTSGTCLCALATSMDALLVARFIAGSNQRAVRVSVRFGRTAGRIHQRCIRMAYRLRIPGAVPAGGQRVHRDVCQHTAAFFRTRLEAEARPHRLPGLARVDFDVDVSASGHELLVRLVAAVLESARVGIPAGVVRHCGAVRAGGRMGGARASDAADAPDAPLARADRRLVLYRQLCALWHHLPFPALVPVGEAPERLAGRDAPHPHLVCRSRRKPVGRAVHEAHRTLLARQHLLLCAQHCLDRLRRIVEQGHLGVGGVPHLCSAGVWHQRDLYIYAHCADCVRVQRQGCGGYGHGVPLPQPGPGDGRFAVDGHVPDAAPVADACEHHSGAAAASSRCTAPRRTALVHERHQVDLCSRHRAQRALPCRMLGVEEQALPDKAPNTAVADDTDPSPPADQSDALRARQNDSHA